MKHTRKQLNDQWDVLKKPENALKSMQAANTMTPAPKIVVDDGVAQVISLPSEDGNDRDVYGRRPGGSWVPMP